MQIVFPRTPPTALEARGGPRKAESVAKELSPISSVSTAQLEGEAGSRGWRAPRSLPVSSALMFHSTVILQKRGNCFKTVPVQRCHHTTWGI